MKKILLISDTHGYLDQKLLKHVVEANEVWHAGDIGNIQLCEKIGSLKPFRAVYGNIDGPEIRSSYPENLIFKCEEVNVTMTHIAGYPGKFNSEIKRMIKETRPKLFICGHSHILKVMYDKENEMLFINPGACGVSGFHKVKTAVRFEIEGADIKNLAVIELGNRTDIN